MTLVQAYRYCDMCRKHCALGDRPALFVVASEHGERHDDYCPTACLIQAALSWIPMSERSPAVLSLLDQLKQETPTA
jgi:hypothetical protein